MKLKNRTKRLVEVNLDSPEFMTKVERLSSVFDPRTGNKSMKYAEQKVFSSLMFLAGETKEVSATVLNAPSVQIAVQRGYLQQL